MDQEIADYIGIMFHEFWNQNTPKLWHKLSLSYRFSLLIDTLVLFSGDLHMLITEAKLALKPLAKIEEGSIVQLFWLKETNLKPQEFLIKPHDSVTFEGVLKRAGLENNQEWGPPLTFQGECQKILSGQLARSSPSPASTPRAPAAGDTRPI